MNLSQLERWRSAGVMPRNLKTPLGRGRGSASKAHPASYQLAEALAMVGRRGRSLHEAVLRIFTVSPLHYDLYGTTLPIPDSALKSAFHWFIRHGEQTLDRRIERALRRSQGGTEEKIEIITRMAGRQYRGIISHPPPTAELRPWHGLARRYIQGDIALTIAKFLGSEEIGSRKLAEIVANVAPSGATSQEIASSAARISEFYLQRELNGQSMQNFARHVYIEEAAYRLDAVSVETFRDLRAKLARVAEAGYLSLLFRDERANEFLDSVYSSHANVVLLYGAIPISVTLESRAWHTMAALITLLLTDDDGIEWRLALDQLFDALDPDRYA